MTTLTGIGVGSRGRGRRPEQTTTIEVRNKAGRGSGYVIGDSLTLVTFTGLGQLAATCL